MNEDIRKIVYQRLTQVCANVYYEDVPHDSLLPYIVFSFPNDGRVYKNQVVSDLQVDIYDVDRDGYNVSREIDRMVREVERQLDYQSFLREKPRSGSSEGPEQRYHSRRCEHLGSPACL